MVSAAIFRINFSSYSRVLSVDGLINTGAVLSEQAFDLMFESVGLEEHCPYVHGMGAALRDRWGHVAIRLLCPRRVVL